MKRIRKLGLAALLALALTTTVGAASASASWFGVGATSVKVFIGEPDELNVELETGSETVTCTGSDFSFEENSPTPTLYYEKTPLFEKIAPAFTEYASCTSDLYGAATFYLAPKTEASCGLEFIPEPEGKGTAAIGPADCTPIELVDVSDGCVKKFGPRMFDFTWSNSSPATDVALASEPTLSYTQSQPACPGTSTTGEYKLHTEGGWRLISHNMADESVKTYVSETPYKGMWVGKEAFEAEAYPLTVRSWTGSDSWSFPVGTMSCKDHFYGTLTKTTTLPLDSTYGNCSMTVFGVAYPAIVETNGCDTVLALNASMSISCEGGNKIYVKTYDNLATQEEGKTRCVWGIKSQSGLTGSSLENIGSGATRKIKASLDFVPSITRESGKLLQCGGGESTTHFTGTTTLFGY